MTLSVREPNLRETSKLCPKQLTKKAMANTVVILLRNVAAPRPPKTAPIAPLPPKAPARPVPFPDCSRTTRIKARDTKTCRIIKKVYIDLS
jgi:hypothetical protein